MIIDDVKRGRKAGAPLIAIATADQPAIVKLLSTGINHGTPIIAFDLIRGCDPKNDEGLEAITAAGLADIKDPVRCLVAALALPEGTILILHNTQYFLASPPFCQAAQNLRDDFKATRRTLIMLAPAFKFPPELAQDVVELDDPLPTDAEIRSGLSELYENAGQNAKGEPIRIEHDESTLDHAVTALRGLAAFPIEQSAAMAIKPDRTVDMAEMRRRMRKAVSQTKGLIIEDETEDEGLDDLAGNTAIVGFYRQLFAGRRKPKLLIMMDEAEKMIGGAGTNGGPGDSSGTAQDQLSQLLTEMETRKYPGLWSVGIPGTSKSALIKAVGKTYGIPVARLDLGGAKGPHVGESEQMIRACLKTIFAIAGHRGALFCATSNRLDNVPPELRRRFKYGIWFFDLPNADEREAIGNLHVKRCELGGEPGVYFRSLEGWSGANIAACCDLAYDMNITLSEAAKYIVPAATQDPEGVERLRKTATSKFLCASRGGLYQIPKPAKPTAASARRVEMAN